MSNIDIVPISIERNGDVGITIKWSDDSVSQWTADQLRKACPCATCREKRRSGSEQASDTKPLPMLPVLSAAEARPMRIESMRPVGNYAYGIAFSDGHSSGVFLFDLLRNQDTTS